MSNKVIKTGVISCFIVLVSSLSAVTCAANNWTLSKDKQGIQVFVRDTPGSAVKSFKGVITIPERLIPVLAVIDDTSVYPKLLHKCKSATLLKNRGNNQNESYKYLVTDMPWPVTDRDTVVRSVFSQDKKTKQVQINMQAVPQVIPPKAGLLRITRMKGRWLLSPQADKKGVTVVYEMSVDPGGKIPKWLVNSMAVDMPFYTLSNLRRLVKQDKYQNARRADIIE